ncbi:hypothetical protein BSKO_06547 [Bryopsis sp. KO-2023]|nr:hypothetical protein BSKO_06547 [Bryopsis sp. KO-2023]
MVGVATGIERARLSSINTLKKSRAAFWRRKHGRRPPSLVVRAEFNPRVVGVGSSAIDYLALVASYPKPDQKLRTEELEVQGGGNCGNALTGAAKLGLKPVLLTKLGDDGIGGGAISELQGDGVDTSNVIIAEGAPSPFTYIIVDREGGTRTCIHTPSEPLRPEEITKEVLDSLLAGARLVYFDGRLTEAALVVAQEAKQRGIEILVEGERLRPNLDKLLGLADYVVTSAHFPQEMTGEEYIGDALISLMSRFPKVRTITTTLGSKGSVVLQRSGTNDEADENAVVLEDFLENAWSQLTERPAGDGDEKRPACMSKNGVEIRSGAMVESDVVILRRKKAEDNEEASIRAREFAVAAAAANAESGSGDRFQLQSTSEVSSPSILKARVWVAAAANIDPDSILDTTGAGDAFIAGTLYSLAKGLSIKDTINLASVSAACKCTALGARAGQPRIEDLRSDLLG